MADRIGQQLGNYRLIHLLGRGGFAEVYLGEHLRLHTQAAVKVLYTQLASHNEVEGFEKEAQLIAHLKHPHIVRVLDYDVEDNTPFLVMDYATGGTLRQRHPKGTVLSLVTIISYVKQLADTLQYAHDQRVIHRDVKPENMLVGEHDELLLSDFGIAIVAQSSHYQSTQTMGGTMAYIAPEQIQGHPRPASDQYSLGIVVYEWLSGACPFHGSMTEIVAQHLATSPPSLCEKIPAISLNVEQVVLTALEKDPHKRFGSVQAFATALEQAAKLLPTKGTSGPLELSLSDIRATLTISKTEAVAGTHRTIALPGGRKASVSVPPGAYDGQVIRLPNQGDPTSVDSSTGTLTLTLAIQQAEQLPPALDTKSAQPRMHAPNPTLQLPFPPASEIKLPLPTPASPPTLVPSTSNSSLPPTTLPSISSAPAPIVLAADRNVPPIITPPGPAFPPVNRQTTATRPPHMRGRTILLIGLALLVIAGSVGLFSIIHANQVATTTASATATANSITHEVTGTAEAIDATSTAIVVASNATATAQAQTTASVIAANPDPYGGGTLALYDPLHDNNGGYNWNEGSDNQGSSCTFTGGAYHASVTRASNSVVCYATSTDFNNFVYQVQMTIIKGGAGGVVFRANSMKGTYYGYVFTVGQKGSYQLYVCPPGSSQCDLPLIFGSSGAIRQGLNQTNLVAVLVIGNTFTLYVNQQKIGSVTDNTFSHGGIGVIADDNPGLTFSHGRIMILANSNPTEVVYSNAKVWKL